MNSKVFPSSAMRHLPTDPIAGFWLFVSLLKVIGPPAAVKIAPIGEASAQKSFPAGQTLSAHAHSTIRATDLHGGL